MQRCQTFLSKAATIAKPRGVGRRTHVEERRAKEDPREDRGNLSRHGPTARSMLALLRVAKCHDLLCAKRAYEKARAR